MRRLYTVAFPTLNEAAARWVGAIRASHDRHASMLGPHFTLLFGCDAVDESICFHHVRTIVAATRAFAIHCSDAEPDADVGHGVVYLVPDVGRDRVTALHDALYTGPMAPFLRGDRDFVAHMTVGHAADLAAAERLSDALNTDGIDVRGSIDAVVVGCVEHGRFVELARFALRH